MSARLGPPGRVRALARLASERFDVVVVGAGATGAGAALDAATRGLSVALVEAQDLAGGTSSRSGKTLHGGLRYLEQGNLALVREAARERNLCVDRLCPHLARPTPFMFPLTHRGWERAYLGAGVALYDLLAGRRAARMPRHRHLTRRGALRAAPALRPEGVTGGVQYYDAIVDDARHTMLLARTAAHFGAVVASRLEATGVLLERGRVRGVVVRDREGGGELEVSGRCVINAAGAWADEVQALAGDQQIEITAAKGIHLVVPRERIRSSTGLITRTADSVLIARPWGDRHWLIGTTDTPWMHARDQPVATRGDVDYLLAHLNRWLREPLAREDLVGVYAGVRPLLASRGGAAGTAALRRDHAVLPGPDGMFSIVGGKYTTYRRMAEDVVDAAAGELGGAIPRAVTADTPLLGAGRWAALRNRRATLARESRFTPEAVERLLGRYGTLIGDLLALIAARPELGEPVPGAGGHLAAEFAYAATDEGALRLDDALTRRTHVAIETPDRGLQAAPHVAELMSEPLGWDAERRERELAGYRAQVEADRRGEREPDDDAAFAARRAVLGRHALPRGAGDLAQREE